MVERAAGHGEPPEHDTEDHGGEGGHEHRSRWPILAAGGAGVLYAGIALYALAAAAGIAPTWIGGGLAVLGTLGVVGGLTGWAVEAYAPPGGKDRRTYRATMALFLATDVGTFGAGFIYYFFVRVGTWPPSELPDLVGSLVLANTAILLVSSVTLHYAHVSLERDKRRRFLGLLGATVLLGVVFLAGQLYEYYEFVVAEGFALSSGVYWSAFYGLTGLHGLHVALGVVLLSVVLFRGYRGRYGAERDTGVTTASLYWHFVDVVWIFLVAVLYVGAVVEL
ncbi:cytochrome c oxidase subunit 3 [Halostella salina]|uniref:cytochrome c oxidase subunit 3 n=1 Tax=Halostella salina TaxID=1547897 RepID=UPI000EF80E84|nr:heme-copper oxidase subunit III [Halostella salina]